MSAALIAKRPILLALLAFFLMLDAALYYAQLPSLLSEIPSFLWLEIYGVLLLMVVTLKLFWNHKGLLIVLWTVSLLFMGVFVDSRVREIQRSLESEIFGYAIGRDEALAPIVENQSGFKASHDCAVKRVTPLQDWRRIDFQIACSKTGEWLFSAFLQNGKAVKIHVFPH